MKNNELILPNLVNIILSFRLQVRAEYLRIIRCQTRSQAYGTGRPWWNKSESFSRSRTWEERHGKGRRSTLQSNIDSSKVCYALSNWI